MDLKWIKDVLTLPDGNMLMVGNTINSLIRNVITPMQSMVGKENIEIRVQRKEVDIFGRTIWMEGADKMDAYKRIEGESLLRAYVDEWTQVPERFTKTMMSRLSDPGACAYGTCNPAGPNHYLYKNYIQRADYLGYALWHFTLADNPWLDPAYKAAIIAENPVGTVFYDRNILGNWVEASGLVFANFDVNKHVVDAPPSNLLPKECRIGIDYGTHNPTAFITIEKYLVPGKSKPTWYVTDEYYWDSSVMCKQKTDGEYSKDLADYLSGEWVQPTRMSDILAQRNGHTNNKRTGEEGNQESYTGINGSNGHELYTLEESTINNTDGAIKNTGNPSARPRAEVSGYQEGGCDTARRSAPVEHPPDSRVPRITYPTTIEVDPSAASFILQLQRDGMRKARAADNNVLDGIRRIATMISKGELVLTSRCPWLIQTMQTYSWNQEAQQDEVIKEDDHPVDAFRYVVNSL